MARPSTTLLPAGLVPRGLTRDQAAAYLGLTVRQFSARVRSGHLPPPVAGAMTWDRAALDDRFDRMSGLARGAGAASAEAEYESWKTRHAG